MISFELGDIDKIQDFDYQKAIMHPDAHWARMQIEHDEDFDDLIFAKPLGIDINSDILCVIVECAYEQSDKSYAVRRMFYPVSMVLGYL